jgi:HD superfamily phosphodiesterase
VDLEVLEISAWLHDIGSIVYGRHNHHITSAEIAEKKLRELNYPDEKTEKVRLAILNHRGSNEENNQRSFIEAEILAEADAIASFEFLEGLFKAAFVSENMTQDEARASIRKKLQNKWNQLKLEESKKIIKPRYDAAMLLLG